MAFHFDFIYFGLDKSEIIDDSYILAGIIFKTVCLAKKDRHENNV